MLTIGVSGSHSGAGKTSFGVNLLVEFPDFSVIKVSPCQGMSQCELKSGVEGAEDADKDTGRYLKVAHAVWWLRGPRGKIRKPLLQLLAPTTGPEHVIIEGNSGAAHVPWGIQVFVAAQPGDAWKPSAFEAAEKADLIIINQFGQGNGLIELENKVKSLNPRVPVIVEDLHAGLSAGCKQFMADLLKKHLEQRRQVREALLPYMQEQRISCEEARDLAADLQVKVSLVGRISAEEGLKIKHCGLGCF